MNALDWFNSNGPFESDAPYNFAFIDESAKREIRRKILKAVAIPGYQVPFGSRDMPIARGWGTGGLQLTLSIIGPDDILKVIDQGADDSVNAVNIKRFVRQVTGVDLTDEVQRATVIQTRHRIPEVPLVKGQILVLQVPIPEPLRDVEPSERKSRRMHAEADYGPMWLRLYENIVTYKEIAIGARYPLRVNDRHIMDPSPIPRWDNPKLHMADSLYLFCAGREKRIYAVPPHTPAVSLEFEDYPFRVEFFAGKRCRFCGSTVSFLDELVDDSDGSRFYQCSDTDYCDQRTCARKS